MPRLVTLALVSLFLAVAVRADDAAQSIPVKIRRGPENLAKEADLAVSEERQLPVKDEGCKGLVALRGISATLEMRVTDTDFIFHYDLRIAFEKLKKGALAAPLFVLAQKNEFAEKEASAAFEQSMTSAAWENGGVFEETVSSNQLIDAKFWRSATLRCVDAPYRATVIPKEVTYKESDVATSARVVESLTRALAGEQGFAKAGLYSEDAMVLIGPDLYASIHEDPALSVVQSPKIVTINPDTKQQRAQLRIKGQKELDAFGAVMKRYLGTARPRIRAATAREIAWHWQNIGWDITEPLLVLDYGSKRIIADCSGTSILMLDELPAESR